MVDQFIASADWYAVALLQESKAASQMSHNQRFANAQLSVVEEL